MKSTCLVWMGIVALLCLIVPGKVLADESREKALMARIEELERRVAALEALVKIDDLEKPPVEVRDEASHREALKEQARARMRADHAQYTPEQIHDAETLYKAAATNWDTPVAVASLEKLIVDYPKANRAGCALLYLGQMSEGEPRIKYYKRAIDDYSDCFYGNGVQVGALGRYLLALAYTEAGEVEKATALREELKLKYPDAINHQGHRLNRNEHLIESMINPPTVAEVPEAALTAAKEWIDLIDTGQFPRSWETAAGAFCKQVTKEKWQESLRGARSPMGKVVSRTLSTKAFQRKLPGAPDGEYVVLEYDTSFEHKEKSAETLTLMLDGKDGWRVAGYYIK